MPPVGRHFAFLGSLSLHAGGDAHATPDTQGNEAALGIPFFHLVQQSNQHPGAAGPDRVAKRNGATIDVHEIGREP